MKRILICAAIFCLSISTLCAQQHVSHVDVFQKPDRTVDFMLEGNGIPNTKTVMLNIKGLSNCDQRIGEYAFVLSNDGVFFVLRPHDNRLEIAYDYAYSVLEGWLDASIDRAYVYRMPVSVTRPSQVSVRRVPGDVKSARDYSLYSFECNRADTVYAVRRGIVTQIKGLEKDEADLSLQNVYLYVEHADGSVARYGVPDEGRFLVKPGDFVYPDTPIAQAGGFAKESGCVTLSIYRFVSNKGETAERFPVMLEYIVPRFATDRGDLELAHGERYTPVVKKELVIREMTEKELKRHSRNKK